MTQGSELYKKAKYGETKAERDAAVEKLLSEEGYCTHFPGYTCDLNWPKACPTCVKRYFTLQRNREAQTGQEG